MQRVFRFLYSEEYQYMLFGTSCWDDGEETQMNYEVIRSMRSMEAT